MKIKELQLQIKVHLEWLGSYYCNDHAEAFTAMKVRDRRIILCSGKQSGKKAGTNGQ